MTNFENGSIVWVRLSQKWWPGRVTSLEECPVQYVNTLKKEPLAIVKFFNESEFHDVSKPEHILSYSCGRKNDIIKKGLNAVKYDLTLTEKFEADVAMAEKLTGGNMDIIKELKEDSAKRRIIDYSDLGFGTPKPKRLSKDPSLQRKGFSDIGEAIQYKRGYSPVTAPTIEHKVKIMEQPKPKVIDDQIKNASNWYKCYVCGFTCGRLNVIIWHNKVHLNKVENYDSDIRIPGRRRRRYKVKKNKVKKLKTEENVDHSQTNGHASPKGGIQEASQLLLDWNDDDDEDEQENESVKEKQVIANSQDIPVNGVNNEEDNDSDEDEDESGEDNYDDENFPNRGQRHPMPKQVDINSAFDALLADSSPLHKSNQNSSYVNNDSDSEVSDWEKYYAKEDEEDEPESEDSEENNINNKVSEKNAENGHSSKRDLVNSSKRNKRSASEISDSSNSISSSSGSKDRYRKDQGTKSKVNKTVKSEETKKKSAVNSSSLSESHKKGKGGKAKGRSHLNHSHSSSKCSEKVESPSSPGPSISKRSSPLPERNSQEDHAEDHSTHSSSSSTSSGPAYMLVAVDAQGNNVPMPVLSEGGNHLVAVEASMEDGTTRTLYIDPAHLGPNVDLNNLMLHIDNSGQETVIIPTSTTDGEIISSTLVEQPVQDSESSSPVEENEKGEISQIPEVVPVTEETKEEPFPEKTENYEKEVNGNIAGDENQNMEIENEEIEDVKIENTEKEQVLIEKIGEDTVNDPEEDSLVNQEEKLEVADIKEQLENAQFEETIEDEEEFDELPDLNVSGANIYSPNDIVWVMTHGLWWPSFVLKIYPKEGKASILYINCQQKTPIKVNLNRLKIFSYMDYHNIFGSQENKAVGLTEAMEMAKDFRELKIKDALDYSPKEFFSFPLSEQRSIINAKMLEMSEKALAARSVSPGVPSPDDIKSSPPPSPPIAHDNISEVCGSTSSPAPQISEDCLSERDLVKLASATKARRSSNERFVKFIKSEPCIEHLRNVGSGSFPSKRHNYFIQNHQNPDYLISFSGLYDMGTDFFGEEDEGQTNEVMPYLFEKCEEENICVDLNSSERKMYISTVLYPEAIKQALRIVGKVDDDGDLEFILANGLYQTRTELKARRIENSW